MSEFTFDRVSVNADGTWSNSGATLRTLPVDESVTPTPYYAPGMGIEVHVVNQHVVGVYEAWPIDTCGC